VIGLFLRLVGLSLIVLGVEDVIDGWWQVHEGASFPWRHLPVVPLYGTTGLIIEWAALAAAGACLLVGVARRPALWLGFAAVLAGLTQRYGNGRALTLLVLFYLVLAPPDPADPAAARQANVKLVEWQLVIVYAFSVLNKLKQGFWDGQALVALGVPPRYAPALAVATLACEVAVPLLLRFLPRAGLAAAVLLHLGFAAVMPGVAPFSAIMIAMATLFVRGRSAPESA
jgi:hypothetical protein